MYGPRKRILLLSDTHSYMDDRILSFAGGVDEVWHAGDIGSHSVMDALESAAPVVRAVCGNIDDASMRLRYPANERFLCNGLDVWITHIGGYPPRYNPRVRPVLLDRPPGLFICGHSHILKVMNDPALACLHMNPGAAGQHGFHKVRTMLRFEVAEGKVSNLEVIELGKRGQ